MTPQSILLGIGAGLISATVFASATMAALLVNTSLESRYPVNLTWIGLDGLPETKGIADILREWGEWRQQTVRRRTQHRLDKCEERLHIVQGRLLAFVRIDEIIKLIRAAEDQADARQKMMAKWKKTNATKKILICGVIKTKK